MKKSALIVPLAVPLAVIVFFFFSLAAFAWKTVEYAQVHCGSEKLFTVTNRELKSADERAHDIESRLKRIASDKKSDFSKLSINTGLDGVPVIMLGDQPIASVTQDDARGSGMSQAGLAEVWKEKIRQALFRERESQPKSAPNSDNARLGEHEVLLLFLEVAILLMASLVFGELFVRLGQPAVMGQICAGLILGQTFFGTLFPDLSALIFPPDGSQSKLIEAISWIGVSFILMLTGMETDTSMLKRLGKPALLLAVIGLLGPVVCGALTSMILPATLMMEPHKNMAFAVLLGTVFAAASVDAVAKVLMDLKLTKVDAGQLILAAALSHDLLSCLLLAVIAVLSGTGDQKGNPLALAVGGTLAFVAVMYFGRHVFFWILRWVNDKVSTKYGLITAMAVLLLLCAATTEALGIHIVLGAFAAGVILSQAPVVNQKVVRPLETVTIGLFAPIFYASAGLGVNLTALLKPELAIITLLLVAAAIASKLAACFAAGKISGLGKWESLAIGFGTNTKGSMGLILATLGHSLNIITTEASAMIIFVSLAASALAPFLMKFALARVKVSDVEKERMAKEERCARTILPSIRRVLWPTSGKGRNSFIAKLLDSIGQKQVIETTLLWAHSNGATVEEPFKNLKRAIDRKHVGLLTRTVHSDNPTNAIAEEANRGYDLVVMATDKPDADAAHVFGDLVDNVILHTSSRVLVVYEPEETVEREIKQVLIPVRGTELSVSAGELGISLAKSLRAKVTCLCIAESESHDLYSETTRSGEKIEHEITDKVEGTLAELARALDVEFKVLLTEGAQHPSQAIILEAQRADADLIVLGAEQKLGKGLFLGHTINFVLRNAPCAVAVLKQQG